MKRFALLPVVLCGLTCLGEEAQRFGTNTLFFVAPLQLRAMPFEPPRDVQSPANDAPRELEPLNTSPHTKLLSFSDENNQLHTSESYELNSFTRTFDAAVYERLDRQGYFTRPELRNDTLVDRAIDNIFQPEVIRFRKTAMSCSLYTAIKRKNPLCLINPIFFNLSW